MFKTQVMAGNVNNLTDARYFAARGVDWLGLDLNPGSNGSLQPKDALAISNWVEGPAMIGEFGLTDPSAIKETCRLLGFSYALIDQNYPVDHYNFLDGMHLFQEFKPHPEIKFDEMRAFFEKRANRIGFFILKLRNFFPEHKVESSHKEENKMKIKTICAEFPVFLSMPNTELKASEVWKIYLPSGIHLTGGDEEKTGFKDFDLLDEILDSLEKA